MNVSPECRQTYLKILSTSECRRAKRYRFEKPRNRFIVTRGILRRLISLYTHCPPEFVTFQENTWGKPDLAAEMGIPLEFNVAHTDDLALYAFSRNRCLGVDVEVIHHVDNVDHLVHNFFSDYEYRVFQTIPQSKQLQAFFIGWTRKEAYVKGRGKGLSIPLNAFDVSILPGEPAALLDDRTDDEAVQGWQIIDIDAGKGYIAALAVEGGYEACEVYLYEYSGE